MIPGRDVPVAMLLGLGLTACVAGVLVSLEGTAQAAPVPPPRSRWIRGGGTSSGSSASVRAMAARVAGIR